MKIITWGSPNDLAEWPGEIISPNNTIIRLEAPPRAITRFRMLEETVESIFFFLAHRDMWLFRLSTIKPPAWYNLYIGTCFKRKHFFPQRADEQKWLKWITLTFVTIHASSLCCVSWKNLNRRASWWSFAAIGMIYHSSKPTRQTRIAIW